MADVAENKFGPFFNLPINLFKETSKNVDNSNNLSKKFTKAKQMINEYNHEKITLDELKKFYDDEDYDIKNIIDFIVCSGNEWGSCYSSLIDFIEAPFKDSSIIDISKVSLKKYKDSIKYWDKCAFSSMGNVWKKKGRENYFSKELLRPYAIKVRVNAFSLEDTDKIWERVYPILNKYKNEIIYRLPKDRDTFVKNMDTYEIGKFLTIYTTNNSQAFFLLRELDRVLSDSSLNIFPFSSLADIAVGDSGVLAAVYDKDYYSISDKEGNKANRRDLFLDLYNELKKENLIYGASIVQNQLKMDALKIDNKYHEDLVNYKTLEQFILYGDYEEFIKIVNEYNVDYNYNNYKLMECAVKSGSIEIIDYLVRKGIPKEIVLINELKLMNNRFDDLIVLNTIKNYFVDFDKICKLLYKYDLNFFKSHVASQFIIYYLLEDRVDEAKYIYNQKDLDFSIIVEMLNKRPIYKEYIEKFL